MHSIRLTLLLVVFARVFTAVAAADEPAPNILYVFTDDQSYRTVNCYPRAYNFANTPNIDQLAKRGVRFDQAYIGAKCVLSRAASSLPWNRTMTERILKATRTGFRRSGTKATTRA